MGHPGSDIVLTSAPPLDAIFDRSDSPWRALDAADRFLRVILKEGQGHIAPGVILGRGAQVLVESGAVIEAGAIIQSDSRVFVGAGSRVAGGACLRGNVVIGQNVRVGFGAEIKGSVVGDRTSVPHRTILLDSVLGADINVAGGLIVANTRLDKREIAIWAGAGKVQTGRLKLGLIAGDRCIFGMAVRTHPGVILGHGSTVWPCAEIRAGFYPSGSRVGGERR